MNIFLPPLRPPGAVPEASFVQRCIRCGKCVTICPYQSIHLLGGFGKIRQTPAINPEKIPCYLCLKCPPVCPTGALEPVQDLTRVQMGQAYIRKDRCHNYTDGIMCMTCYDRCPLRGSAVILAYGLEPAMTKQCVGCGICVYVCPVKAISLIPKSANLIPETAAPLAKVTP